MAYRRKKYGTLKNTDHRLDLSPVGRNIFVSREKQMQHQAARRVKNWMRVVLGLALTLLGVVAVTVFLFYLAPWFQQELSVGSGASQADSSPLSSLSFSEAVPEYDEMGLAIYSQEECLFVVNSSAPAEEDFSPELEEVGGVRVDKKIAPALRLLLSAAKEDGLKLVLTQGYVSYEEQKTRFENKVKELGESQSLTTVMARAEAASIEPEPGQSDFQSGRCVRIDGDPATFADSRTYSWLKNNMGKYGFAFRFPEYKADFTGIKADPTVIRYVGSQCAAAMQQRSMCLEEYIDYLNRQ